MPCYGRRWWLSPFSVLTGLGLMVGYALLGACWLNWKTEGPLQEQVARYAGRLGLALNLAESEAVAALFSESNGRLLVEVPSTQQASFEARFAGLTLARLGVVTDEAQLSISLGGQPAIALPLAQLCAAWLGAD